MAKRSRRRCAAAALRCRIINRFTVIKKITSSSCPKAGLALALPPCCDNDGESLLPCCMPPPPPPPAAGSLLNVLSVVAHRVDRIDDPAFDAWHHLAAFTPL